MLLDVTKVYDNSYNFKSDPLTFIAGLPAARIAQINLAGHTDAGAYLFGAHDGAGSNAV